jgi:hypothetical protein
MKEKDIDLPAVIIGIDPTAEKSSEEADQGTKLMRGVLQ